MDEYKDIETAARHRDWQGCARIMFSRLFRCAADEQRNVAAKALDTYVRVWKAKHKGALRSVPDRMLTNKNNGTRPPLPDFPEDLDPADAEFENGLLAFYNGAYFPGPDGRRTVQFATAIRSAVTARQINIWMRQHPDNYARWKAGREFGGATFLDDDAAADEAERAWKFVDHLLNEQRALAIPFEKRLTSSKRIAKLYDSWEDSVL